MSKDKINSISLEELLNYKPTLWDKIRSWFRRTPSDVWWWFKWRLVPGHRYNVVRTGLEPGYYDPCTRIVCAIMEETVRYVRSPWGAPMFDWTQDEEHRKTLATYTEAAEWWEANRERFRDDFCGSAPDYEKDEKAYEHTLELAARVVREISGMWYA